MKLDLLAIFLRDYFKVWSKIHDELKNNNNLFKYSKVIYIHKLD